MNRIIGIDYGSARTGLAVSDPLGIFASPMETVTSAKIIEYLQNYARTETIVGFVVGYPLNLDGRPAQAAPEVDRFLEILKKAFPDIPVRTNWKIQDADTSYDEFWYIKEVGGEPDDIPGYNKELVAEGLFTGWYYYYAWRYQAID